MDASKIALEIGRTIRDARIDAGFKSRASLVDTKSMMKGKKKILTQESLRKIENGERVPRLETLRKLTETLGLDKKRMKEMEQLALQANIQRVTRRAGNVSVRFQIEGKPVHVAALPPKQKTESFVRDVVGELTKMVEKYGVLPEDVNHFRQHARHAMLQRLA